ncbi:endonuclease domain-containing protein [Streptomyces luteocolor]|uniref:endonuclease domain-containing protein n=1 Tax=Streptomyces luteocolor TaxID=285500 RepID=UPI00099F6DBD|nr:endonuclease domain-containing protein [Streptomyces luteocolor]
MSSRIMVPPPRKPAMTPQRARHLALIARIREQQQAAGLHPDDVRCGRPLSDGTRLCKSRPLPGLAGCARHLDDEEWQDTVDYPRAYFRDALGGCCPMTVEQQVEQTLRAAEPPACHSWPYPRAVPVPDEDSLELLVSWQAGRCAGCGHPFHEDVMVDHCHESGLVRGLLCGLCNNAEGTAPPRHPRWFRYRILPPTLILGVDLPYSKTLRTRLTQVLASSQDSTTP